MRKNATRNHVPQTKAAARSAIGHWLGAIAALLIAAGLILAGCQNPMRQPPQAWPETAIPAGMGSLELTINNGETVARSVTLLPIFEGYGTGVFSWAVEFPPNAVAAWLSPVASSA